MIFIFYGDVNMSKTKIVTLRVPVELKSRLERAAKQQGVSVNNLANYFLATQLSQLETLSSIESRISRKSIPELQAKVKKILESVPHKESIPSWDRIKDIHSEQSHSV